MTFRREILTNLSWPDYLAEPGWNPSRLVHGLKSMKHMREYQGSDKPDRAKLVGSMTHTLIFEPETFHERYAIWTGGRRDKRIVAYREFMEENADQEITNPDEFEQARIVSEAVLADYVAASLLNTTDHEVSLFCEDLGLQCKGRVDALGGLIVDLKTTTNTQAHAFGRVFSNLAYGAKLACYKRWAELLGHEVAEVYTIAVEVKPPYDVAVYRVPEAVLENAWPRVERVMRRIPECEASGTWPGVAEGQVQELVVPNWAMDESELDWSEA